MNNSEEMLDCQSILLHKYSIHPDPVTYLPVPIKKIEMAL